jgi:hypothetical protein
MYRYMYLRIYIEKICMPVYTHTSRYIRLRSPHICQPRQAASDLSALLPFCCQCLSANELFTYNRVVAKYRILVSDLRVLIEDGLVVCIADQIRVSRTQPAEQSEMLPMGCTFLHEFGSCVGVRFPPEPGCLCVSAWITTSTRSWMRV